jgi:chemotaxis response regulator CheB
VLPGKSDLLGLEKNTLPAIAQIKITKPDVVVLDLELPETDGIELIEKINHYFPHINILIFSYIRQ